MKEHANLLAPATARHHSAFRSPLPSCKVGKGGDLRPVFNFMGKQEPLASAHKSTAWS